MPTYVDTRLTSDVLSAQADSWPEAPEFRFHPAFYADTPLNSRDAPKSYGIYVEEMGILAQSQGHSKVAGKVARRLKSRATTTRSRPPAAEL